MTQANAFLGRSRHAFSRPARQRGVALLVVLWACTLLAIMLGGYAVLARTEALQARYQANSTRAHYAAEAGVMEAIQHLADPRPQQRWIADGRSYTFDYDGARLNVSVVDESGKVDLNAASPQVLQGLFKAAGMNMGDAQTLAQRVVDWRSFGTGSGEASPSDAAYAAAGLPYRPRHGPFASIEELRMVLGMPSAIYQAVASQVTLWSGREAPDPTTAPPLALASIPGMSAAQMQQVQQARRALDPGRGLVPSGGVTDSIHARATLPNGTQAVLRATIRLRGVGSGTQPYAILRWQEGETE